MVKVYRCRDRVWRRVVWDRRGYLWLSAAAAAAILAEVTR